MNEKKIRTLIEFYINNEQGIHCKGTEGYKWDIFSSIRSEINAYVTKHCRNGEWDQDYSDFHEFTRKTIGKTGNLVYSSSRSVMQKAADKNPEYIRKMFIDLSGFYSDQPLEERVQLFISAIDQIAKDNPDISKSGKSFHQDYRAVSVYLLMMDPKNNYNYMYSTFSDYARFAELDIPKAGDERLLLSYYNACNTIRQILQNDYKQWCSC